MPTMPTLGQIKWRVRQFIWRLRANWRPSLGFAVIVSLVFTAAFVTVLTVDWPLVSGSDAVRKLASFIGGRPTVIDGRPTDGRPTVIRPTVIGGRPTVIDGDTVRWQGRAVRLVGIDAPETGDRARCQSERARGDRATARLRELVASGTVKLELIRCACQPGTEGTSACNFGRSCGVLMIDGRDAGHILIGEGLARPYHCGQFSCPRRGSWC
jgi:endonuclease YncB( thermonuclease family)